MTDQEADALRAFLLARIAEDEAWARGATQRPGPDGIIIHQEPLTEPGRMVRESAAKREVLKRHFDRGNIQVVGNPPPPDRCAECRSRRWPCETLRALASAYADHPEYDEAWK